MKNKAYNLLHLKNYPVDIKQKLLSGTWPVRAYIGKSQTRKSTSKASKLILADIINDVNGFVVDTGSDQSSPEAVEAIHEEGSGACDVHPEKLPPAPAVLDSVGEEEAGGLSDP